jgi:hypothetical protein
MIEKSYFRTITIIETIIIAITRKIYFRTIPKVKVS